MADDTFKFTTSSPSRRSGETFTETLKQLTEGPNEDIVVVQDRIGHGATVHYLGPARQPFSALIRVAEVDMETFEDKHTDLMKFNKNFGTVVVTPGTSGEDSDRKARTISNALIESIVPSSETQAGNEYVKEYIISFIRITKIGDS